MFFSQEQELQILRIQLFLSDLFCVTGHVILSKDFLILNICCLVKAGACIYIMLPELDADISFGNLMKQSKG